MSVAEVPDFQLEIINPDDDIQRCMARLILDGEDVQLPVEVGDEFPYQSATVIEYSPDGKPTKIILPSF